jgi:pantoate kinase
MTKEKKVVNDLLEELKKLPSVQLFLNEETSFSEKLLKAGLSPAELVDFLKTNIETNRNFLEVKKDAMAPEEFYTEMTKLNRIEAIMHYLEDSL